MMQWSEYNGWENTFTWLVHLHLSNDQAVMHEMVELVAWTPDDRAAGQLIARWLHSVGTSWLTGLRHHGNARNQMSEVVDLVTQTSGDEVAGRLIDRWRHSVDADWVTGLPQQGMSCDAPVRLLLWDVVGTALAFTDWDALVRMLMGQRATCGNPFTVTLHTQMTTVQCFQDVAQILREEASSPYTYADGLHAWFREHIEAWFDAPLIHRQHSSAVLGLVEKLIQDVYSQVVWEHVARAFRPGY